MTSHEYADKLSEVVRLLQTSKEFEMPQYTASFLNDHGIDSFRFYQDKERFVAAARALGSGRKVYDKQDFEFHALDGLLRLVVDRDAVCRVIKPAVPAEYECEPLLSEDEVDSLPAEATTA